MTVFLTVAEVIAIHADPIDRYGGSPGPRDRGRLEAAVFRPESGYYPDPIAEAAALLPLPPQAARLPDARLDYFPNPWHSVAGRVPGRHYARVRAAGDRGVLASLGRGAWRGRGRETE